MTLARGAERLDHHADELGGQLAARDEHERVRLERQELGSSFLVDKLRDAAGEVALFVDLEPVALRACLHLAVGQELVDLLARERAVGDGDGLDGLVREGPQSCFPAKREETFVAVRSMRRSGLSLP